MNWQHGSSIIFKIKYAGACFSTDPEMHLCCLNQKKRTPFIHLLPFEHRSCPLATKKQKRVWLGCKQIGGPLSYVSKPPSNVVFLRVPERRTSFGIELVALQILQEMFLGKHARRPWIWIHGGSPRKTFRGWRFQCPFRSYVYAIRGRALSDYVHVF